MKEIVKQFVRDIIERGEEDRASRTKIRKNEREDTYLGLSDAFDHASNHDLTAIAPPVGQLLTTHGLSLEKDSTEYRVFLRLVLQGFMAALKVEASGGVVTRSRFTLTAHLLLSPAQLRLHRCQASLSRQSSSPQSSQITSKNTSANLVRIARSKAASISS